MATDKFHFPIGDLVSSSIKNTYSSLINSIISRITTRAMETVEGKPVCMQGYYEIVLFPKTGSDLALNHANGRVRILFDYHNLYLVAFKSHGMWHKFPDLDPKIVPDYASNERKKYYKVKNIPFESNYGVRGMSADISELKISKETPIRIYKTLSLYDSVQQVGRVKIPDLQKMLFVSCAVFSEVLRFPLMKKQAVYLIGRSVNDKSKVRKEHTVLVQQWSCCCKALREGRQAFEVMPDLDIHTFDELLAAIGVVLPI